MLAEGTAASVAAVESIESDFLQSVVDSHAAGREELLNLYCGTPDGRFIQSNREAGIPEGFNPVERGWYIQASAQKGTIVTDPYLDGITGQMCATIATPILIGGEVAAVIGLDVTMTTVSDLTENINYTDGAYGFLVDGSGNYVTHPNKAYAPRVMDADTVAVTAVADVLPEVAEMLSDGTEVRQITDYDGVSCYFSLTQVKGSGWMLGVVVPAANVTSSLRAMAVVAVLIALVIMALVAVFMSVLIGKMLAPVQVLKQFASGDFSENAVVEKGIPAQYKDETEQIETATLGVKRQIRGIILNTKQEAENIETIAERTSGEMTQLNQDISGITDTIGHVMKQTTQAKTLAQDIQGTSQELGQNIESVARKAREGATQSGDIMERAARQLKSSEKSTGEAVQIYQDTKAELEQAIADSQRVKEIDSLTEEILAISSQTNLLALNASIEAARAGEVGKGFAVVADEIRMLADNSRQAVDKIRKVTEGVVENVSSLSESSEKILRFMNEKVMEDYQGMTELARMYEQDAVFYNDISGQLGAASEEMSSNMEGIRESILSVVSLVGEIADQMQTIEQSAEDSNEKSQTVLAQMGELSRLSEQLNQTVASFKV